MKTRKIASLVAGLAVVASFGAVSAYAAEGYLLEMNNDSTADTRLVDVYYVGSLEDIGNFSLELNGLIDASVQTVKFNSDIIADKIEYAELGDDYAIMVSGDTANAVVDGKLKLGTLEIVFPNETGDVAVSVDIDESWLTTGDMTGISGEAYGGCALDPVSFTIVKDLSTGDDKTPIDAAKLDTYDTYADDAVTAYTAVVPAADVDKTFEWGFKNADGVASSFTKTAKFEYKTVVSGEAGIVLGLKVVGDMPEGVSVTLTEVE